MWAKSHGRHFPTHVPCHVVPPTSHVLLSLPRSTPCCPSPVPRPVVPPTSHATSSLLCLTPRCPSHVPLLKSPSPILLSPVPRCPSYVPWAVVKAAICRPPIYPMSHCSFYIQRHCLGCHLPTSHVSRPVVPPTSHVLLSCCPSLYPAHCFQVKLVLHRVIFF